MLRSRKTQEKMPNRENWVFNRRNHVLLSSYPQSRVLFNGERVETDQNTHKNKIIKLNRILKNFEKHTQTKNECLHALQCNRNIAYLIIF